MAESQKKSSSRDVVTIETFPFGKTFAVTLVDDTDYATLPALRPVYSALNECGVRITKTVWPLKASGPSGALPVEETGRTATLEDKEYLSFCLELQQAGHEMAMHTASGGDNSRTRTIEAYDLFEQTFGHPPYTNVMHGRNRENIYWGKDIFQNKLLHHLVAAYEPQQFLGHDPTSTYYWGDICRERTKYVRLLETRCLNTLAFDPATPFHDPCKPDVRWWFSSTYGAGSELYRLVTADGLQALRAARGASILHTYCVQFAQPSGSGGYRTAPAFRAILDLLGRTADGWYVPAVELLDRIRAIRHLRVSMTGSVATVTNASDVRLTSLALAGGRVDYVRNSEGRDMALGRNGAGQVPLGDLKPGEAIQLELPPGVRAAHRPAPHRPNYAKFFAGTAARIASQYLQGVELVPWAVGRVPRTVAPLRPRYR